MLLLLLLLHWNRVHTVYDWRAKHDKGGALAIGCERQQKMTELLLLLVLA
jgi:hypothetical protein